MLAFPYTASSNEHVKNGFMSEWPVMRTTICFSLQCADQKRVILIIGVCSEKGTGRGGECNQLKMSDRNINTACFGNETIKHFRIGPQTLSLKFFITSGDDFIDMVKLTKYIMHSYHS